MVGQVITANRRSREACERALADLGRGEHNLAVSVLADRIEEIKDAGEDLNEPLNWAVASVHNKINNGDVIAGIMELGKVLGTNPRRLCV